MPTTVNYQNQSKRTGGSPKDKPTALAFRYSWGGWTETHDTPEQFKMEHPAAAGMLLDLMLGLGVPKLQYKDSGDTATIEILER